MWFLFIYFRVETLFYFTFPGANEIYIYIYIYIEKERWLSYNNILKVMPYKLKFIEYSSPKKKKKKKKKKERRRRFIE